MSVSLLIIYQILSMFIMIAVGVVLRKTNLLEAEAESVLSKIALKVLLPCVIIHAFQVEYRAEIRDGLLLAFLCAIVFHVILILLSYFLIKKFHYSSVEQAALSYPNSGEILIPLVISILTKEFQIYCCAFLIVQLFFLFTHGDILISGQPRIRLKNIFCNINVIAIGVATIIFLFQISLPSVVSNVVDSFSKMMSPVCMLAIGISIGKYHLLEVFSNKRAYIICFFRLIGIPFVILLFVKISGITHIMKNAKDIILVVYMATASSVSSTIINMAYYYKKEEQTASSIYVMSILLLMFTLPIMVMLYQNIV